VGAFAQALDEAIAVGEDAPRLRFFGWSRASAVSSVPVVLAARRSAAKLPTSILERSRKGRRARRFGKALRDRVIFEERSGRVDRGGHPSRIVETARRAEPLKECPEPLFRCSLGIR
jgi:hypothetical protein